MILYQSLIFFIFNYLVLFIYYNYFLVISPSVGHMGKVPLFSLNPSLSPSVVCWGYPQPTKKKKKKKRWDQNVMSSPFCVLIIFVSFVEEPNHLTHAISCLYYFICIGTSWVSMSYLFCLQLVILEDGVFKISNSLIIVWSLIERTLPLTRNSSFWTITSFLGSSYVTVLENLKLSTIRLNILLIHLTIWWLSKMILENSMLYFP